LDAKLTPAEAMRLTGINDKSSFRKQVRQHPEFVHLLTQAGITDGSGGFRRIFGTSLGFYAGVDHDPCEEGVPLDSRILGHTPLDQLPGRGTTEVGQRSLSGDRVNGPLGDTRN
jgi:hypothetical protein